jgi:hypothetical protein
MNLIKLSQHTAALIALSAISASALAQAVRMDVEPAYTGCHQAVAYNNSNQNFNVTYDYEYKGQDGSYFTSRNTFTAWAGRKTTNYMNSHTVDCNKRYTVRITNWQAR